MVHPESATVRRRHVFFIAGFDPKSPRYYQALYRREARRQSLVSGLPVRVDKGCTRPTPFSTAWRVGSEADGEVVDTVVEILQWDDIVRAHWTDSAWGVLTGGVRAVAFGLRDGAVGRMFRLFRPPVYAAFLPIVLMLMGGLLAVAIGIVVASALSGSAAGLPPVFGAAAGTLTAFALTALLLRLVHRMQITWLLRLLRFTVLQANGQVAGLDDRLAAFATRIAAVAAAAENEAVDEILVVGHSVGASLAIDALGQWLDRQHDAGTRTPTLLSLGHCMPLLSALTPASRFRQHLQRVANAGIDWLDITAPIDWAAFPGIDPVTAAGLPPAPAGWHPRLLSPRFHRLFSPATYAVLKRKRFKVHRQYLMAGERPGRYDYFAITAGPLTLRQRFAGADSDGSE